MEDAARQALHLRIARWLLAGRSARQLEEAVFAIVDQFNRGAGAITEVGESDLLCSLNILAGMKAKAGAALVSARSFLDGALALMPPDMWEARYPETLELCLALCECEYLAGHFERAEELAALVLAHARDRRDSARVHLLRIGLYQVAGRMDEAVASMVEGARLFDVAFPDDAADIDAAVEAEVGDIGAWLQGRSVAEIADARPLADADIGIALALLVEAIPAAYMVHPAWFSLIIARAVRLSLRFGPNEDSCFAYSCYGILLIARRRDIASALAFSAMALRLNDKLGGRRRKGRLVATHAIAYSLLQDSMAQVRAMLDQSFAASMDVGDLVYASYIKMIYFWLALQQGVALDDVMQETGMHAAFARDSHNEVVLQTLRFQQQFVANMKGQTRGPSSMDSEDFDEAASFAALEMASFGFGMQSACIARQVAAFIRCDYAGALAAAECAGQHAHESGNMIIFDSVHHFFLGLTLAALYPQATPARQREFAARLSEELDRHGLWAASSPDNFTDRLALLQAEVARIEGRAGDAARLYEQAIRAARRNGFVLNEAIAFELAAGYYRSHGFDLIADTYLREARAAFARWGADAKVAQLDAGYPQLLAAAPAPAGDALQLDLLSVVKASQAVSSQIVLDELVDTLMRIVLENAGAQAGYLLLVRGEELVPAAEAALEQHTVQVRRDGGAAPLPASILNYVRRSLEPVLLHDAAQPNQFSGDPYFASHRPKSVLCLPILRQEALAGMLYLENKLATHAFAPMRVAALQLLASQAAISLENARLFAESAEREAKIRRLFESNIVGIFYYSLDGNIIDANDAGLALIQYSREELREGTVRWREMTPPEWRAADERALAEIQATGVCRPFEKEYVLKDGSRLPVLVTAARFEGSSDQGVAFVLDLSERKRVEEQVRHMANHDVLTGLPNRTLLHDRLNQAISVAHRSGGKVGLLFIDLDLFKYINESLGHQVGDIVLKMAGERLQGCLREGDSVARLGGDEFVIVLPVLADGSDAALVADKALELLAQPFQVDAHELHASGSIGISLYPDDGLDAASLMRAADTAMYHAKETGRGKFQFFTAAMNRAAQQRMEVGTRLRHALVHDEFVLHYQPQVDMDSGSIMAAEALLRWQRPGGQPVSCGSFIGNAEESGLIVPIGEWTLRQACRQLRAWRDAGHQQLKIAVNLSPRQLEPPDFCALVRDILDESGLPADALELEITESIFLQRSEINLSTLTTLRDMGVILSVDDFGTGYSSLAYLQRFPVHALKIDQSFIRDIGTDRNHTALITAIIAMARSLQLGVMAEGVETREQASFLLAHGCHFAQGFYYSRAVPAQVFADLLRGRLTT
jgi:diguanylate cyclase (GGDEF)-like protein/PAS domain S-box-containing protein